MIAIPWRYDDAGNPVRPLYDGESVSWQQRVGVRDWQDVDEPPDRVGKPSGAVLLVRCSFFNEDGSCPDPTGTSGEFVERNVRVRWKTAAGLPFPDDLVAAEIKAMCQAHVADIERDVARAVAAERDAVARAELVRRGVIDKVSERPNKAEHDQRRRVFRKLGDCIDCGSTE